MANERFESVAEQQPGVADCITIRAVRPDEGVLVCARRLLRPSGRMILFENPDSVRHLPGFSTIDEIRGESPRFLIRVVVPRGTND